MSTKQKLNTRSLTEAELVAAHDALGQIIWTQIFLSAQGYDVSGNQLHQDNQSAILLEKYGKSSSTKRTKHMHIWYFYIADQVNNKVVTIVYCPTEKMVADFFTKPLQGSLFRKHQALILNMDDSIPLPPTTDKLQECIEDPMSHKSLHDLISPLQEDSVLVTVCTSHGTASGSHGDQWIPVTSRRRKRVKGGSAATTNSHKNNKNNTWNKKTSVMRNNKERGKRAKLIY